MRTDLQSKALRSISHWSSRLIKSRVKERRRAQSCYHDRQSQERKHNQGGVSRRPVYVKQQHTPRWINMKPVSTSCPEPRDVPKKLLPSTGFLVSGASFFSISHYALFERCWADVNEDIIKFRGTPSYHSISTTISCDTQLTQLLRTISMWIIKKKRASELYELLN